MTCCPAPQGLPDSHIEVLRHYKVRVLRFQSVAGTCRAAPVGPALMYHGSEATALDVARLLDEGVEWGALDSVGDEYIWVGEG